MLQQNAGGIRQTYVRLVGSVVLVSSWEGGWWGFDSGNWRGWHALAAHRRRGTGTSCRLDGHYKALVLETKSMRKIFRWLGWEDAKRQVGVGILAGSEASFRTLDHRAIVHVRADRYGPIEIIFVDVGHQTGWQKKKGVVEVRLKGCQK